MKHWRKITIGIVALSSGCILAQAGGSNAYATIGARNVFGLLPVLIGNNCAPSLAAPLPKITPDGMMTVFGRPQVLFKVVRQRTAADRNDAENFFVLGESERYDDIQVLKIDMAAEMVTFDNHGTVQQIPMISRK